MNRLHYTNTFVFPAVDEPMKKYNIVTSLTLPIHLQLLQLIIMLILLLILQLLLSLLLLPLKLPLRLFILPLVAIPQIPSPLQLLLNYKRKPC